MKMKKYGYSIALLMMALSLSLAGCKEVQSESDPFTQEPSSEAPGTAEPSMETEEPIVHALSVEIREGREEDLEEGACWQYTADEDGIYLVISPDDAVYSFKFVAIHVEEGLQYLIDEELYAIEELTPDKPFLVKMQFVGLMPTYGIVFEDQNHDERFYTINMAGIGPEEGDLYFLNEIAE